MNESTLNLIQAVANGDALETEQAFSAAMAEKLSVKLDDMRTSIAQSMFNQEVVAEEAEEIEEEVEQVEEDVEQLDELSPKTLKSYDKKSTKQSMDALHKLETGKSKDRAADSATWKKRYKGQVRVSARLPDGK
jgi:hypothetical protein